MSSHDKFPQNEDFDELPEDEFLKSEQELKREIKRLERQIKKIIVEHHHELELTRAQIGQLLAKNMELSETCNLFAKGLDTFKKDHFIVTQAHHWTRKGARGLRQRIGDLVMSGERIATITPLSINPQGDTIEAIIVTEKTQKMAPLNPFKE